MRVHTKAYAKINLSLNVFNSENGYHNLDSVVSTVDLYDEIIASKRKDDRVNVIMRGIGEDVLNGSNNNAYKAAMLFKETFKTKGMDIKIVKNIPLAGGLGGSSADVAGVLNALKELFDVDADVKPLADRLGSDSGYLLTGGFAKISGRGEVVEPILSDVELWIVLVYSETGVNTGDCFKKYDEMQSAQKQSDNEKLINAIVGGDLLSVAKEVGNDLAGPAISLCDEMAKNLNALKALSPLCTSVSGSGATTFAIFETRELALWARDKLLRQGYNAEAVPTVNPQKAKKRRFLFA
ncbi:MAG: 4-(cytidine 5'-diphospho)-2-C-methyl-D-erythritol kinase [Clostridia bacterium]|nr:4-(cytidine 5'-diphospho)-2-C-methyl-D-erythritol kinase [Clostridia bacterium]